VKDTKNQSGKKQITGRVKKMKSWITSTHAFTNI